MHGEWWFWVCVGFAGQALFTSRFLVQWIASERKGESVLPIIFWHLSLGGGLLLLLYAISRSDPVIITGQALGVIVYARNLVLVYRKERHLREMRSNLEAIDNRAGDGIAGQLSPASNGATILRRAG